MFRTHAFVRPIKNKFYIIMNRSTYQLNAYTSDWGGGHVGVHASVCVSGRRSEGELTTGEQ